MTDPRSPRPKRILVALGWVTLALTCAVLLLPVGLGALWSVGAEINRGSYLGSAILMSTLLLLLLFGMGYSVRAAVRAVHPEPGRVRAWVVIPVGIGAVLLFLYLAVAVRSLVAY